MSSSAISKLNEYCQQRQLPIPEYNTLKTDGPLHMPMFTMRVVVDEREFVAEGASKKAAKSKCAAKAVQELGVDEYFNERVKKYRYRICEVSVPEETDIDPIETLWKDEAEEIVLTIRRYNDLDEHDLKIIKLRVLK
jgi:hypothetical protein